MNMISSGSITISYLNQSTSYQDTEHNSTQSSSRQTYFSQQCENKLCGVIVDKPSEIFHTKIISKKSKSVWLCINCYNSLKNGQYCYYCNTIYNDVQSDTKTWIQCDYCKHWEHLECEEKKGKINNISKLLQKNDFKYMCPLCRIERERKQKEEEQLKQNLLKKKRLHDSEEEKKKGVIDIRNIHCDNNIDILKDFEMIEKLNKCKNLL